MQKTPQAIIESSETLPPEVVELSSPIVVSKPGTTVRGVWGATQLRPTGSFPAIIIQGCRDTLLTDFSTFRGSHGIRVDAASHIRADRVQVTYAESHGVLVTGGSWCNYWNQCQFKGSRGAGYYSVSTADRKNGNNTSFVSSQFWLNGIGLSFGATTLAISGCLFEQNRGDGIQLLAAMTSCHGISISGCHLESNEGHQIFMRGAPHCAVSGVDIAGNMIFSSVPDALPLVASVGPPGTVRFVALSISNELFSRHGLLHVDMREAARYCTFDICSPGSPWQLNDDHHAVRYCKT